MHRSMYIEQDAIVFCSFIESLLSTKNRKAPENPMPDFRGLHRPFLVDVLIIPMLPALVN